MVEKRAEQILQLPSGVELELRDQVLFFKGRASAQWREKTSTLVTAIGGVSGVDFSGLQEDDPSLLLRLKNVLDPPPSVEIAVTQGVAIVSGFAPTAWVERLNSVRSEIPQLVDLNSDNLISSELQELRSVVESLNGRSLYFGNGVDPAVDQELNLAETIELVRKYEQLSQSLGLVARFQVFGYTDGVGDPEFNRVLMLRRANAFRDAMLAGGVSPQSIIVAPGVITSTQTVSLEARRAEIRISPLP